MGLFIGLISIFQLSFNNDLGDFTALMAAFGLALVSFTYFFSAYFHVQDEAFKKAATIYFILGIFVPALMLGGFVALKSADVTKTTWYTKFFYYLFFIIDPLFTFFAAL